MTPPKMDEKFRLSSERFKPCTFIMEVFTKVINLKYKTFYLFVYVILDDARS